MPYEINETHDPNLKSWVESANDPSSDFPIQNLPLCYTDVREEDVPEDRRRRWDGHICVAIGSKIIDISRAEIAVAIVAELPKSERGCVDDQLMYHIGCAAYRADPIWPQRLRLALSRFLRSGNRRAQDLVEQLGAMRDVNDPALTFNTPEPVDFGIRNYTDFYASVHHATTVGAMFRPDNPLLPNYKHVPIGYHGRASSIVASGTEIRRPNGQQSPPDDNPSAGPSFGPCKLLDYELELGFFVGPGNELGQPISISEAEDHIFGVCLVNDWSARDMQKWEYQPLGPFLAKNFATSISPYVVTMEALAPFRAPAYARPEGDPRPLPYLWSERDQKQGGLDITLEVYLASKEMRDRGMAPIRLSKGSTKDLYWTPAQMLAHHTSNGCNMQAGDLFASGTVSGPTPDSRGCLLELTWDGQGKPRKAIELPTGEKRVFLADGDEVIFKGYCEREGFRRIGLGECRGVIAPAVSPV